MGVVPVTVFAQWEFRILLARSTMYMGTLCAMETIHLLDKEREVESECRVPEKPIARRAQPLPGPPPSAAAERAAVNGIADCAPIQRYVARYAPESVECTTFGQSTYRDEGNYLLAARYFKITKYQILISTLWHP